MRMPRREQTDGERLQDQVYAAMETGNTERARLLCKSHEETFPEDVDRIRDLILKDYNTRL